VNDFVRRARARFLRFRHRCVARRQSLEFLRAIGNHYTTREEEEKKKSALTPPIPSSKIPPPP
jgi:hypothetical protein